MSDTIFVMFGLGIFWHVWELYGFGWGLLYGWFWPMWLGYNLVEAVLK